MLQLGQGRQGRLLQPPDHSGRRDSEAEGNRHRLVIVEQQWRELPPGAETVSPTGTGDRFDRITQVTEAGDIPPDRPRGHLESPRQFLGGPVDAPLEQPQQFEKTLCAVHPLPKIGDYADSSCPQYLIG
jgi:hypothetical protein